MRPKSNFSARAVQAFSAAGYAPGLHTTNAADAPAEIMIYDAIGDDGWGGGVTATAVTDALRATKGGPVNIRINSPGGSVFDGMAIYNALLAHPGEVTCFVDGVAASAASFIACAGGKLVMGETSMLMIHNASTMEWGDHRAMSATAAVLSKIDGQLAAIYAGKSGGDAVNFAELMNAETWMTAEEAVTAGLADSVAAAPKRAPTPAAVAAPAPVATAVSEMDIEVRRRRLRVSEA